MTEEPLFTIDEGWLYQFISWLQIEKEILLIVRGTCDPPTFDDMISHIKEFVEKKKRTEEA